MLYSVRGFGRIGSYEKARTGHYSRKRLYWSVVTHSNRCSSKCKEGCQGNQSIGKHYPEGWVKTSDIKFRTKKEAEAALLQYLSDTYGVDSFKDASSMGLIDSYVYSNYDYKD